MLSANPVWHIPLLCVQWKTPDDGQSNCPKRVEFYFKNKYEKLVHLVGFITEKCKSVLFVSFVKVSEGEYSYCPSAEVGKMDKDP
jgi:hypothetical protein